MAYVRTIREFDCTQDAWDYRHNNGTGGWIFSPDGERPVILFPPDIPPTAIMLHPMTKGKSGKLLAN